MGWGSGSRLMDDVMVGLNQKGVADSVRETVYRVLIPAMQDRDWDTEMDCMGKDDVYDDTLKDLHPEWFADGE